MVNYSIYVVLSMVFVVLGWCFYCVKYLLRGWVVGWLRGSVVREMDRDVVVRGVVDMWLCG